MQFEKHIHVLSLLNFPIAVSRYLLRDLKIPVNFGKSSTFNEFQKRYGCVTLESADLS